MDLKKINRIYFIGIGGIGMSALAKYFHRQGKRVSGYDRTPGEITDALEATGIAVHFDENMDRAPKDAELIIYTPAIPKDHKELVYYQQNNYPVLKRSEVLQMLTERAFTIAVAGTHGKTTVTSMIAHILKDTEYDCTAFLGGICMNFNSNYVEGREDVMVVEADEFDRSFLRLNPDIAVITAIDPDHLDIYGNTEELENNFLQFTQKVKPGGKVLIKEGLGIFTKIKNTESHTYSLKSTTAEARSENMRIENGQFVFDYVGFGGRVRDIQLKYPGIHNVENAVAAISVGKLLQIGDEPLRHAITTFKGIHRRFEYILKLEDIVFIDDYAHHPAEISAFLNSVRMLYPHKKITAVFQPHLFTRTRDFTDGFAESLELADEVVLLDIYPARELPIEGVTSEIILNKIIKKEKQLVSKEDLIGTLKQLEPEVLLTIGAGDIDKLVKPIKEAFEK